jgi:hypothetical protein
MKRPSALLAVMTFAAGLVAAGSPLRAQGTGSVVVQGNNEEKKTYDCRGGTGVVNGDGNVLTFRNCTQVTVNGNKNTIDVGVVTTLTVRGNGNNVTWVESEGKRPRIVNAGTGNTLSSASGGATAPGVSSGETGPPPARPASGSKTTVSPGGVTVSGARPSANEARTSGSGSLVLNENRQHRTHDCAGGGAVINSNENVLTLSGCRTIAVSGNQNTIDAVAPGTLRIDGNGNTVTWTEGAAGPPRITDNGSDNHVSRKP